MRLDSKPIYRKVISPWYDSEPLCFGVIGFTALVLIFAVMGVSVAGAHPVWRGYLWVPVLLAVLSTWVMVSISIRLVKRILGRRSDESRL